MIEKRLVKQISKAFEKLQTSIVMYDNQGECIYPVNYTSVEPPVNMYENNTFEQNGYLFALTASTPQYILAVSSDRSNALDVLTMATIMVETMLNSGNTIADSWDVYRRILREEITGSELEALAIEYQISLEQTRCVILFHIKQTGDSSAFSLLNELIPQAEGDALVEMDRHTVVLLKDMDGIDDTEELRQFSEAVQETLMNETAHHTTVSIGTPRRELFGIGESYREARRAMEVGRIFNGDKSIFVFSNMMLERFLSELPRDITSYYHGLLFNRKTAQLFNEEMLYTIEMFFKKDLNLSDTARQLYIHRNTLVYRLDKVQRIVGLDLRNFEDAVTFKILLELKKSGAEKPQSIH